MLRSLRILVASALVLVVPLLVAQTAGKPSDAPKYDVSKEVTIKGKVDNVVKVTNAKGQIAILLLVKSENQLIQVRLCPNTFLEAVDVQFAKGDDLTITGSKVTVEGKDVVLAREITRGDSKIVLREKDGTPVWTWLMKG